MGGFSSFNFGGGSLPGTYNPSGSTYGGLSAASTPVVLPPGSIPGVPASTSSGPLASSGIWGFLGTALQAASGAYNSTVAANALDDIYKAQSKVAANYGPWGPPPPYYSPPIFGPQPNPNGPGTIFLPGSSGGGGYPVGAGNNSAPAISPTMILLIAGALLLVLLFKK